MRIEGFCIDWKVVAGLAAVAVGFFMFRPRLFTAVLPVLLVAACPLSMLVMMWGMRGMGQPNQRPTPAPHPLADRQRSPHEQIAGLRSQLSDLQSAQLAITEQIRSLEASLDRPEPTVTELAQQHPS